MIKKKKEIERQISIQRQIKAIEIRAEVARYWQESARENSPISGDERSARTSRRAVKIQTAKRPSGRAERFSIVGIQGRSGVVSRARVKTVFCAASPLLVAARTMKRTVGGRQALRRQIQFTHYRRVT